MRNAYEKGVAIGRALGRTEVVAAVEAVPYPTGFVTPGGAVEQFRADILRAARDAAGAGS